MLEVAFHDGSVTEYTQVEVVRSNDQNIYFMEDMSINIVTFIPFNSIKYFRNNDCPNAVLSLRKDYKEKFGCKE